MNNGNIYFHPSIHSNNESKIIMVLAATNHPWDIDEAFRRRFEKRIYIGLPNGMCHTTTRIKISIYIIICHFTEETRSALLDLCLKGVHLSSNLDTNQIADKLAGFTGSDIANVCRYVH